MANKEKKTQEQPNQTPAVQAKETKAKKGARARWIFRLIIVLLAGALAYGIYYNLKTHQDNLHTKTNRPKTTFVAPRPTKVIPIKPDVIDIEETPDAGEPQKTTAVAGDMANPTSDTKKADTIAAQDRQPTKDAAADQTKLPEATNAPIILAPQEHADIVVLRSDRTRQNETDIEIDTAPKTQETFRLSFEEEAKPNTQSTAIPYVGYDPSKPHFTAADALELRDNFLSEEPCGDDLRKLIMSDNQSQAAQDVIKATSYFCFATTNVQNELKNLFLKSKKEALIRYYKEHDARWKYRLKKVYVSLIKTRNLNPTGNSVPDLLDRAHNALLEKNMTLTIETLSKLPDNIRPVFTEFMQQTNNFVKAKAALDALILSYAKGE